MPIILDYGAWVKQVLKKFAVAVVALWISGCSGTEFMLANAPNRFEHVERHLDLAYGDLHRQHLDVLSPPRAAGLPVVIFFYGGSWIEGSKEDYRFVATTLAEHGIVAVIADYRLYPEVTFPAFEEDGARAIAWVQHHASEYGGDPRNVILMGHSAGGHTAAFLAFDHEWLRRFGADPTGISGLIGLSGTYVFVPDSDVLRAAFPAPYSDQDWQPIRFVDAHAPPTLLLHGLADKEVLPQEAIELCGALRRQSVRVEMHLYPHRGHAATVAPFALLARWRTPSIVAETVAFVRSVSPRQRQSGL
jgi:acetyl esterase/lipase